MFKKEAQKNHILGALTCCLESTPNRAVTLIQQSCISNTPIEQSPQKAYAITKQTKLTSILKIIDFKRK